MIHESTKHLWAKLPAHLRLDGRLCLHHRRRPFEQDFLLSARLTYLQVLFLLGCRQSLKASAILGREDSNLLGISEEMLSLVVEAIILRERLVNSGTGLVWKVRTMLANASLSA